MHRLSALRSRGCNTRRGFNTRTQKTAASENQMMMVQVAKWRVVEGLKIERNAQACGQGINIQTGGREIVKIMLQDLTAKT